MYYFKNYNIKSRTTHLEEKVNNMEESKTAEVRPNVMKALVIGISNYDLVNEELKMINLPHCVRDAKAVAKLL